MIEVSRNIIYLVIGISIICITGLATMNGVYNEHEKFCDVKFGVDNWVYVHGNYSIGAECQFQIGNCYQCVANTTEEHSK